MRRNNYKPPFPYFGGKSPVAHVVWSRFGNVANYVEPFFGSGAVLFLRPTPGRIETINDADGFVANFWRALQHDSEAVAFHADWPVNEADLHARHMWLVGQRERITDRLCGHPEFYDAKIAGWWVWGQSCWIGGGWCSGEGPWQSVDGVMTLGNAGQGVRRQLPHLGDAGQGVHRKFPHLGDAGQGVKRSQDLLTHVATFAERLRNVRVCCGDWSRVCRPSVTTKHGLTGVFLDPPYSVADRVRCYSIDSKSVSIAVREWALEHGNDPLMRICLAGYEGEHEMPGWSVHEWTTQGGYANRNSNGNINRTRERLWFSPHCQKVSRQLSLFEECTE
jgi:hypothetical protein